MLGKFSDCEKKANMSAAFKTMMPSSMLLGILPASDFIITIGRILNKSRLNDGLYPARNGFTSQWQIFNIYILLK